VRLWRIIDSLVVPESFTVFGNLCVCEERWSAEQWLEIDLRQKNIGNGKWAYTHRLTKRNCEISAQRDVDHNPDSKCYSLMRFTKSNHTLPKTDNLQSSNLGED